MCVFFSQNGYVLGEDACDEAISPVRGPRLARATAAGASQGGVCWPRPRRLRSSTMRELLVVVFWLRWLGGSQVQQVVTPPMLLLDLAAKGCCEQGRTSGSQASLWLPAAR